MGVWNGVGLEGSRWLDWWEFDGSDSFFCRLWRKERFCRQNPYPPLCLRCLLYAVALSVLYISLRYAQIEFQISHSSSAHPPLILRSCILYSSYPSKCMTPFSSLALSKERASLAYSDHPFPYNHQINHHTISLLQHPHCKVEYTNEKKKRLV